MPFRKTGECPIQRVFCRCGQELKSEVDKCPKCGKALKATKVVDKPAEKPTKNNN